MLCVLRDAGWTSGLRSCGSPAPLALAWQQAPGWGWSPFPGLVPCGAERVKEQQMPPGKLGETS